MELYLVKISAQLEFLITCLILQMYMLQHVSSSQTHNFIIYNILLLY